MPKSYIIKTKFKNQQKALIYNYQAQKAMISYNYIDNYFYKVKYINCNFN